MALVAPALWGPVADEDGLRDAADRWRAFATHLECTVADLAGTVRTLVASGEGASIDAVGTSWEGVAGADGAQLGEVVRASRSMADALDEYAEAVADIRRQLVELAATIVASVAVGAAVAWATAGASAVAAAGTVAVTTARAAGLAAVLASRASTIPRAVGLYAAVTSLEAIAVYAVVEPARIATFHRDDDPFASYAFDEALFATVGAAIPSWRMARSLRPTTPPALPPLPKLAPPTSPIGAASPSSWVWSGNGRPAVDTPLRWGSRRTLTDHLQRHGPQLGVDTEEQYVGAAKEFFRRAIDEGLPMKIDEDGVIRIWEPPTRLFGSYGPTGTVKTFFVADETTYFLAQPGVML